MAEAPDKREKPRSHLEHIPRRSLFVESSAPDTRRRVTEIAPRPVEPVTETVTKTPEVVVTKPRSKGGRPKGANSASPAERQRAARQRKKAEA